MVVAQEFSRAEGKELLEKSFVFFGLTDRKEKKEWNRPRTRINHRVFEENSKIFSGNCLLCLLFTFLLYFNWQ